MNLTINYWGDIGNGAIDIIVDHNAAISELIEVFHQKSELPQYFQISGGAPPNRRTISVSYDYKINLKSIKDTSLKLTEIDIKDNDTVSIKISRGRKVD